MILTIDTQKIDSPDVFGELMREHVFAEKLGCYTCFDLVDGFNEMALSPLSASDRSILEAFATYMGDGWILNNQDGCYAEPIKFNVFTNGEIVVAWYWDGDGVLVIAEGDQMAINTDCKKDHGWEWVKINDMGKTESMFGER